MVKLRYVTKKIAISAFERTTNPTQNFLSKKKLSHFKTVYVFSVDIKDTFLVAFINRAANDLTWSSIVSVGLINEHEVKHYGTGWVRGMFEHVTLFHSISLELFIRVNRREKKTIPLGPLFCQLYVLAKKE